MNAVFFEVTKDSTTMSVHQARRKALASNPAYPEYALFGINAFASDLRSTHQKAGKFGLFSGMGHGSPNEFEGQATNVFDTSDSVSTNYTLSGATVHLYSCDCGRDLGPHLVRKGARAFIGYIRPVGVPNVQSTVEHFVRVATAIDLSILRNESYGTTKTKADSEFALAEASLRASPDATPRDLATFRMNHRAMVGPWTNSYTYGAY